MEITFDSGNSLEKTSQRSYHGLSKQNERLALVTNIQAKI